MLRKEGYDTLTAADGETALAMVGQSHPELVLVDLCMTPMSGLDVLRALKETVPAIEVIMMTAYATVETAVTAMKLGAFDYVMKPFKNEEVVLKVQRALERRALEREVAALRGESGDNFGLVGDSPAMRQVLQRIAQSAATDLTVLITGETGTGKTAVARAIHAASRRANGPFVHVNCAAVPEALLESELFGHERGAFTGAVSHRRGLFEEASRGTLFLDEIALLPVSLQSKLLTVLEDGIVRRVGGNRAIAVDVRVVAATNAHLRELLADGRFRQDLFFRLNVASLHLPPLRERRQDVPLLIRHFLSDLARHHGRELELSPDALALLMDYPFPGNVRELSNLLSWAYAVGQPPAITVADLPEGITPWNASPNPAERPPARDLAAAEWQAIERTITATDGNLTRAAKILGIGRTTLWRRLREYRVHEGAKSG